MFHLYKEKYTNVWKFLLGGGTHEPLVIYLGPQITSTLVRANASYVTNE